MVARLRGQDRCFFMYKEIKVQTVFKFKTACTHLYGDRYKNHIRYPQLRMIKQSSTKIEELIQQIRKLIWHFHQGRTVSTINFNYDAYADLL